VLLGRHPLAAHLHDALVFLRGLDHCRAVFTSVGHRLFDIDVLTRAQRVEHDALVPMIGCRHNDCIDVFPVEQFLVLCEIRRNLTFGVLLCAFEVPLVAIADFHQVCLPRFFGGLEQYVSANPEADEPEVYAVIRPCRFRQRGGRKID
jgi:hypothetical protein